MTELWAETHAPHNFLILSSEKFTQDLTSVTIQLLNYLKKKTRQTINNANQY